MKLYEALAEDIAQAIRTSVLKLGDRLTLSAAGQCQPRRQPFHRV